jgi:hypothetical protein
VQALALPLNSFPQSLHVAGLKMPHFGQALALSLILFPHSLQSINAIIGFLSKQAINSLYRRG